jgi:HEAT repeat protein
MKKPDPIEQALDRLGALRSEAASPDTLAQELRKFLSNKSNLVVAKAARIAGELRSEKSIPDMVAAFERLMADPGKLDKGCAALTEITGALYELDYLEPEIYFRGIHHVQMEGAFGPPVDVASKLRAFSALGLARTRYPHALEEVVALLVDREPEARIGAVRALASNGGEAGVLLLRLKVLNGDPEPDVMAECFSGLLAASPERSLSFVAEYAESEDAAVAEAAILALGTSRRPAAFDFLKEKWERSAGGRLRKTLLLAMALTRADAAIEFLVALLESGNVQTARDTITALALYRDNQRIRQLIEAAVSRRGEKQLTEAFRRELAANERE